MRPSPDRQFVRRRYQASNIGRTSALCLALTAQAHPACLGSSPSRPSAGGTTAESSGLFDVPAHLLATAAGAQSEGVPNGVPSDWDWVPAATATRVSAPGPQYSHVNYWGALFRGERNTTPINSLVQVRGCSLWFLLEDSPQWLEAPASVELEGATFSPAYAAGGPSPPVLEPAATGIDVVPAEGHIFHFWQRNGYQPLPSRVREIVVNCQARLALRDAGAADDRTSADYLIHVGADFRDPTDPKCERDQYVCPSWGVSRLERITSAWRNHTFHSLTEDDLLAGTPPPPAKIFDFDE